MRSGSSGRGRHVARPIGTGDFNTLTIGQWFIQADQVLTIIVNGGAAQFVTAAIGDGHYAARFGRAANFIASVVEVDARAIRSCHVRRSHCGPVVFVAGLIGRSNHHHFAVG